MTPRPAPSPPTRTDRPHPAAIQRTPARCRRGRRAFSLPELVVVLAVVGAAAAIALPRYGSAVDRYRADGAARAWAERVTLWAQLASSTGATVVIDLDLPRQRAVVRTERPGRAAATTQTLRFDEAPFPHRVDAASFAGTSQLTLNPYGMPKADGAITLAVGSQARTIDITGGSALTVRVRTVSPAATQLGGGG